jgi:alkanesulfonate monooxygenase SsuD/methylene tetrahydromethanopterin reductase-like flavin-dependent oxidoreductase (luciferase family)
MSTTNLLEQLANLLRDPVAYREDPEGVLASCGDVSPADIHEALLLLQDRQDADFNRDHHQPSASHVVHVPPPPPPVPQPGESNQEAAVRYLDTYITNNHSAVDDRDTEVDSPSDAGGGDFDEDIDPDSELTSDDEDDDEDDEDDDGDDDGDDEDEQQDDEDDEDTAGFGLGDTSSTDADDDSVDDDTTDTDNPVTESGTTTSSYQDIADSSDNPSVDDHGTSSNIDEADTDGHAGAQESYSTEVV